MVMRYYLLFLDPRIRAWSFLLLHCKRALHSSHFSDKSGAAIFPTDTSRKKQRHSTTHSRKVLMPFPMVHTMSYSQQ